MDNLGFMDNVDLYTIDWKWYEQMVNDEKNKQKVKLDSDVPILLFDSDDDYYPYT